ncbi:hypothetical protein GW950_01205 [Candidatus Wolfebacteria bacterium]|nr:hypothetical protein [Candidatus Wolfebacteria bacterium]
MKVAPAINTIDFKEVKSKLKEIESLGADWAHLDVADGEFTKNNLWNNPEDLISLNLSEYVPSLNVEVHLMTNEPDSAVKNWLNTGIKRIYIHYEVATDIKEIKKQCDDAGVELGLAIGPNVPVEGLFEFKNRISHFLILTVTPGLPGQKSYEGQIDKIKLLRLELPDAKIEVDGGIELNSAREVKLAGADSIVSASYIWNSDNFKEKFELLKGI